MAPLKKYTSARAFRTALEERLKVASITEQTDLNRLRRQVSFDRLLARLFREESPPWILKGGYALELRFKDARSTVDIDLTVQRVTATVGDQNQIIRATRRLVRVYGRAGVDGLDRRAVWWRPLSRRSSDG
jgi:hypothetical protein